MGIGCLLLRLPDNLSFGILLTRAGVKLNADLFKVFAIVFACDPRAIYEDLRRIRADAN